MNINEDAVPEEKLASLDISAGVRIILFEKSNMAFDHVAMDIDQDSIPALRNFLIMAEEAMNG